MSKGRFIFLSHVLSNETVGYGGQKDFQAQQTQALRQGRSCNQSEWRLNNHIGTHIDAPSHFSDHAPSLETFSADFWIFEHPQVVMTEAKASQVIEVGEWCEQISTQADLLLLKTGFEKTRGQEVYWAHNPGLSPELGVWLRQKRPQVRAVGFDFISLTSYDNRPLGKLAHQAFLHEAGAGHPILIIEDMHLSELIADPLKVFVTPLRVENADGSPVTVIAQLS